MTTKTPEKHNRKLVCDIVNIIRGLVKAKYGSQKSARREIEYAFHAALLIVDEATRHQSDAYCIESLQKAAAMFADIAETEGCGANSRCRSGKLYIWTS